MTPNGRFEANREICLSISGHHEETWQPAWGVRTALVAYVALPCYKYRRRGSLFLANMSYFLRLRSFMETDARGQLGGLETTDTVRQRLASESSAFKCAACGKTNGEIIKECEERAKEVSSTAQEVEVPKELNMGWRDEMEAKKKAQAKPEPTADEAETAELAEGFVQTAPNPTTVDPYPAIPVPPADQAVPHLPSGIRNPTPTRTTPLPAAAVAPPRPARLASDDGVPLWLDRLIVVMVVLLVALVLKILFAL